MTAGDDIGVALAGELTHDGGAYHASVTSYVYFGVFIHVHSVMRRWRVVSSARRVCRYARVCAVGGLMIYVNTLDRKADN